jgi:hypothetical protein
MNLPHLTQTVLLDRGFAVLLDNALFELQDELTHQDVDVQLLTLAEALSLKPLTRLRKRLAPLVLKERNPPAPPAQSQRRCRPKPPRPHRLRVEYDELAVIRLHYARLLTTTTGKNYPYLLATALACFHQPSLTLESRIRLLNPEDPESEACFGARG